MLNLIIFIISVGSVFSFPGDHNSLTCDTNFIGLNVPDLPKFDTNGNLRYETRAVDETALQVCFRNTTPLYVEVAKICRKNIVDAIKADLALPHSQSKVKQNIRANLDDTFEGKPLPVTKWGDSLSDFVSSSTMKHLGRRA